MAFFPSYFSPSTNSTDAFNSIEDNSSITIGEIWDGNLFNYDNTLKLVKQVSGDDSITLPGNLSYLSSKLSKTATDDNITAAEMRAFTTGGKKAGNDIIVRFGGLDWTPTYLSKDKSDNVVLTIWLTNNEQDAFQSRTNNADEGLYYGFVKNPDTGKYGLYSDWSADWGYQNVSAVYPAAMYGTSYIRAVTLNNGGVYAINYQKTINLSSSADSVFALFTIGELAEFIITPSELSWQEIGQSAITQTGAIYNYPNENWSPNVSDEGFYSSDYNYAHKNYNDIWKNDKLWLPSLTEIGCNDTGAVGIWNTSISQKYNTRKSSFDTNIGSLENNKNFSTKVYSYTWLRSGHGMEANYDSAWTDSSFDNRNYINDTYYSCAVRPALHLNLSKISQNVDGTSPELDCSGAVFGETTVTDFTVTATDSGSGVKGLYMQRPGESSYSKVSNPITINTSNAKGKYYFYAEDNAGNRSDEQWIDLLEAIFLTDLVSTDQSNPNIWMESGESEDEMIFHIKSSLGFSLLFNYNNRIDSAGWDPKWTVVA